MVPRRRTRQRTVVIKPEDVLGYIPENIIAERIAELEKNVEASINELYAYKYQEYNIEKQKQLTSKMMQEIKSAKIKDIETTESPRDNRNTICKQNISFITERAYDFSTCLKFFQRI